MGGTLKVLVGKLKASVLLQVVSVNPNSQLVVAYLVLPWEAANQAVSLVKVDLLVQVVSEQAMGRHLSSVVKIFTSKRT